MGSRLRRGHLVSPATFKAIRERSGLSARALATVLGAGNLRTITRWERGERAINGSAEIIMEMLDAGELPARYLERNG